jgi:hypothetical protein
MESEDKGCSVLPAAEKIVPFLPLIWASAQPFPPKARRIPMKSG